MTVTTRFTEPPRHGFKKAYLVAGYWLENGSEAASSVFYGPYWNKGPASGVATALEKNDIMGFKRPAKRPADRVVIYETDTIVWRESVRAEQETLGVTDETVSYCGSVDHGPWLCNCDQR